MANIFDSWFEKHTVQHLITKQHKRGFLSSGIQNDGWSVEQKSIEKIATPQEVLEELHNTLKQQLEFLQGLSTCLYCKKRYRRLTNLGRMNCKWHPDPGPNPYIFDCCKQEKGRNESIGCTRCDHTVLAERLDTARWNEKNRVINVPLQLAREFNIPTQNYTISDETDPYLIKAVVKRCEGV